jgi:short subunit dehydrogenase-like uncharacterized protein
MAKSNWLIYGANGYTGQLVIEEALRKGHKPILAGRSEQRIRPIAEHTGLKYVVADPSDINSLKKALSGVELIFNAAGPFIHTGTPIIKACLDYRINYTDITGEIPVFQNIFSYDSQAKQKGITLMSGIGFDVIPTDCLAKYVTEQVPGALELELAFAGLEHISPGTMKTMVEMIPGGGLVRRDGKLVAYPLGRGAKKVLFPDGNHTVIPLIWGDLETAYHSTGVKNITTYMAYPDFMIPFLPAGIFIMQKLFASKMIQRMAQKMIGMAVKGPGKNAREKDRSYVWARAVDDKGNEKQAWLDIPETYLFTAIASVLTIEKILELRPKGSLTPAMAFGADFVLQIQGTKRYDTLPD